MRVIACAGIGYAETRANEAEKITRSGQSVSGKQHTPGGMFFNIVRKDGLATLDKKYIFRRLHPIALEIAIERYQKLLPNEGFSKKEGQEKIIRMIQVCGTGLAEIIIRKAERQIQKGGISQISHSQHGQPYDLLKTILWFSELAIPTRTGKEIVFKRYAIVSPEVSIWASQVFGDEADSRLLQIVEVTARTKGVNYLNKKWQTARSIIKYEGELPIEGGKILATPQSVLAYLLTGRGA